MSKILIKFPSRNRLSRFFSALDACVNNIQDSDNYHVSCTLDEDDSSMNNQEVVNRINQYKNVSIEWGTSTSKVNAINRSMPAMDWDILVNLSDDQFFNVYGWDSMVRMEMNNYFPNGDGYLHFKEKDSTDALCVQTICDRKYYDRFGYIYHPEYKSLFVDNHQMEVAKRLGRYVYIPYEIMTHLNPAYGYLPKDEMFEMQQIIGYTEDHATFLKMQARNFDL